MISRIPQKTVIPMVLMIIFFKQVFVQEIQEKQIRWYIDYDSKPACGDEKFAHKFCESWKSCGLCTDEYDIFVMRRYCALTCEFCKPAPPPECLNSKYGCCWDWKTEALSPEGEGCPPCRDDFRRLCTKFVKQCEKNGRNGKYIRQKCSKTCGFCRKDVLVINKETFNRQRQKFQ